MYINKHNKNPIIPYNITSIIYKLPNTPLPKLPPNLRYLRLDKYDYPLQQKHLPQSLVSLHINFPYKYSVPSHQNLRILYISTTSIKFNKVYLPNLKRLIIPSSVEYPIDAYLPNLEFLHIYAYKNRFMEDHLLHTQYMYYLQYHYIEWIMSKPWYIQYFANLRERVSINKYNKIQRQTSLFDDLLDQ